MKYIYIVVFLAFLISCKGKIKKEIIQNKIINTNSNTTKAEKNKVLIELKQGLIDKDFILGKYNYRKHEDFIKIAKEYSSKTIYLNKEAYNSFIQMYNDAKKEKINLKIISGTRNFYEQKVIWERKWVKYKRLKPLERAKKILEFSSMPSTSRHHWGTDIDINNLNNSYFEKGNGKSEYSWLVLNANKYGFYQVYTNKKDRRTGYNIEKWHWSYLPLSSKYLDYYIKNITNKDINNFKGSKLSSQIEIIDKYVKGVSYKVLNYQ